MKVRFHLLIELRYGHSKRLLNRLLHRRSLDFDQPEILAQLRHLFFVEQVMHQNPGLRIKQSMVSPLLPICGAILHCQQIRPGQPYRILQNLSERF